jgi:hypothetical protein
VVLSDAVLHGAARATTCMHECAEH